MLSMSARPQELFKLLISEQKHNLPCRNGTVREHNLALARHPAMKMSAIGLDNYCKQFKLSYKVWLASIVEGGGIINATLLYLDSFGALFDDVRAVTYLCCKKYNCYPG